MRIVIVANSQGTPAGGVSVGSSYPELVQRGLAAEHAVAIYAESGWSIRDFNAHVDEILALQPDLVVLQVGVVECSRRILSTREKRLLQRIRGSTRLTLWLHDRRKGVILWRSRLRIDTRLFGVGEFDREIARFVSRLRQGGVRCLLLETPQFGLAYEREHFPLLNEDIELFNRVLRRHGAVPILRPGDDIESIWIAGTVHLTERGHALVAERLVERLQQSAVVAA
ncbi:MAG TPA: SGNH/GDSL hydrolase family protein [Gaiellaceae bacterium]|nr:SGNH/GDSL hydrolase family protein [Gaiellaceae bacterium]